MLPSSPLTPLIRFVNQQSTQPTTTLQALVNLKRPTLRLSPLVSPEPDDPQQQDSSSHPHHHGLEFEYDCDAPKCGIYVHVLLPADHPDATNPASTTTGLSKLLVFESLVDGGFGKILKLEEGAMLELGRFEYVPGKSGSAPPAVPVPPTGPDASVPGDPAAPGTANTELTPTTSNGRSTDRRRRFTHFNFRRRQLNHSVSGPALAVVDAEPASVGAAETAQGRGQGKDGKEGAEEMEGVRVMIRLAALDEQGTELGSPNEQVTYLHVVRFGVKGADIPGDGEEQDARPWVVKVVKREATVGAFTFYRFTHSNRHGIHTPRSAHTRSTYTRSTASPPLPLPPPPPPRPSPPSSPPPPRPRQPCFLHTPTPRPRRLPWPNPSWRTSRPPSASCACRPRARWCSSHAGIWWRVRSAR